MTLIIRIQDAISQYIRLKIEPGSTTSFLGKYEKACEYVEKNHVSHIYKYFLIILRE